MENGNKKRVEIPQELINLSKRLVISVNKFVIEHGKEYGLIYYKRFVTEINGVETGYSQLATIKPEPGMKIIVIQE